MISNCAIVPLLINENARDVQRSMDNDESKKRADSTEIQSVLDELDKLKKEQLLKELHTPKMIIVSTYDNTLYLHFPNSLMIYTNGFPDSTVNIICEYATIEKNGQYNYLIYPNQIGQITLTVQGKDIKPTSFNFNVKQTTATVQFGSLQSDTITVDEFKKQRGLITYPEIQFSGSCKIYSFSLTRISKDGNIETIYQKEARLTEVAKVLQQQATSGDIYLFENILYRCPGNQDILKSNDIIFRIK